LGEQLHTDNATRANLYRELSKKVKGEQVVGLKVFG
jgi:hypothetical protein